MGLEATIIAFWMLSLKLAFSPSCFTLIKRLSSSSSLSAICVLLLICISEAVDTSTSNPGCPRWPVHLGWQGTAWLTASVSFTSLFTTRMWSTKGNEMVLGAQIRQTCIWSLHSTYYPSEIHFYEPQFSHLPSDIKVSLFPTFTVTERINKITYKPPSTE